MKILAIETSCDETSVAVVEDGIKIHSLVINSQIDIHKAFGGVVPEIAARSHIEVMLPVVQQALNEAFGAQSYESRDMNQEEDKKSVTPDSNLIPHNSMASHWDQIDAIAVTQGPGLSGSLLIGVLTARTLAWSFNKPLYPVHHILGHVYANWITEQALETDARIKTQESRIQTSNFQLPTSTPSFPVLALIVSGGHTQLMLGTDHENWRVIGRTQDDAVGEAFDKVAKVLGLPYPGGPSIAKVAEGGDPNRYILPTPKVESIDPGLAALRSEILGHPELTSGSNTVGSKLLKQVQDDKLGSSLNFSFSGLKTAVLRAVQKECGVAHDFPSFELAARLSDVQKADFAASFQAKAIDYLVSKTKQAYEEFMPKTVIIGGGVAASLPLRQALSDQLPIEIQYAPQILCTDNAAMIGARAYFQSLISEPIDPHKLEIQPSWPL
jgi:N6-L-threonylcarbamoyladenine synthase